MSYRRTPLRSNSTVGIQTLEDRRLLAVFGEAWPDERDLAISFPVDGVQIGSYDNDLNALLDSIAPRQEWQELVLRSYQTWSLVADLNVGLQNDYNNDFGVPGKLVGDPRFGEFRIGAFPQQGLIANSVPFQSVAGTYSGDLILNSNENFTFHDWQNNLGPDPATIGVDDRDLFSLLLHETGNTLGLDDNMMDWTVMFRQYTVPKGVLTAEDIAAIQAIYGERSDPYEVADNGSIQSATLVPTPPGFDSQNEVLRTRGSLVNGSDVDVYKIVPVADADSVTIRTRAYGVSLLQSKLEVVDSLGQVLDEVSALSVFSNDNELTIEGINGLSEFYVRVSASDPADVYSVGDYFVEVDYRSAAHQASDPEAGAYNSGPDLLFANYDLADTESGMNDTVGTAAEMTDVVASESKRFELTSSVASLADVDYFKITAPASIGGRLVAHVTSLGSARPDLQLQVVDANGQAVGTAAKLHDDGTFTVEVASPQASQDYFLKVSVDPNSSVSVGNYVAVAEFESTAAQMNDLASGTFTGANDRYIRWTAQKTKLFRFDLQATGADPNQAVRLTVYDAHTREIKMVAVTGAGLTRGTLAWLQQGEYILRFTAISHSGGPITGLSYQLRADGISDDQDEDNSDPADDPNYDPYYYEYTNGSGYYGDPDPDYYGYYSSP